jgi:transcriptional regulator with XRE-family HTH domain
VFYTLCKNHDQAHIYDMCVTQQTSGAYHLRMKKAERKKRPHPQWAVIAKSVMRNRKMTQEDLLPVFEVTTIGAVSHYMTGNREPSIRQLLRLAKYLGLSVAQLTGEIPLSASDSNNDEVHELLSQIDDADMPLLLTMLRAAADRSQKREGKK